MRKSDVSELNNLPDIKLIVKALSPIKEPTESGVDSLAGNRLDSRQPVVSPLSSANWATLRSERAAMYKTMNSFDVKKMQKTVAIKESAFESLKE